MTELLLSLENLEIGVLEQKKKKNSPDFSPLIFGI
jgi:hypothetical protein